MPQTLSPTGQPTTFGGLGRLEWSAGGPDDPFPVWTDITQFIRTEDSNPVRITRGRQTELDQVRPSQLICRLDNTDNRFTFGYTGGPYGSTWTPGKKVRYTETVANRTFTQFTGWIEYPDVDDWQPIGLQYVQLTCVDRLTRLARGQKFVSTLAAYVLNKARNGALKGYWPMNGTSLSFPDVTFQQPPLTPDLTQQPSLVAPQFNNATIAPGDDLATLAVGTDLTNRPIGTSLLSTLAGGGVSLAAGQVMTIIAWLTPNWSSTDLGNLIGLAGATPLHVDTVETPAATGSIEWGAANVSSVAVWAPISNGNPHWTSVGSFPPIGNGWAFPIMMQYGYNPTVQQAYYGDVSLGPFNLSGSTPTGVTITTMRAPYRNYAGGIAHVQLYVGAPSDFTVTDYLAQLQAGMIGLEYQLTGQRINTLLDYAGIPATDRAIDPGQSYMQKAKLAGLDPYTAIQNAVTTERGRGFAGGDGRYTFHDRVRILNV